MERVMRNLDVQALRLGATLLLSMPSFSAASKLDSSRSRKLHGFEKDHVKQCWTTSLFHASFISSSTWNFGDAKSSFRGSQHYHIPQNGWLMQTIMAAFGWWPRWFRDNSILVAMLYIMGKPQPDSTSTIGCLLLSSTRLAYWYVCSEQLITVLYLL